MSTINYFIYFSSIEPNYPDNTIKLPIGQNGPNEVYLVNEGIDK